MVSCALEFAVITVIMASNTNSEGRNSIDIIAQRQIVKFMFLEGLTAAEAHRKLVRVMTSNAFSQTTVKQWYQRFRVGNFDVTEHRGGDHKSGIENEERFKLMKAAFRESTAWSITSLSARTGIPRTTCHDFITKKLHMRKINTKWVPHRLTQDQNDQRVINSQGSPPHVRPHSDLCQQGSHLPHGAAVCSQYFLADDCDKNWVQEDAARSCSFVLNDIGLSDLNQNPTEVDQRVETGVYGGANNIEMIKEGTDKSMLAADGGTLVKQEPLDRDYTETCHNVYDSLLDVYKQEPSNESSEMEHYCLVDSLVDTPATITDFSVRDVKTHIKVEPLHVEASFSVDCPTTQATCLAKDRATPQDAKTGEASSVQQNCLGPRTQQTLDKLLATDSREASSADSAPRGSVVRRGDAHGRRELLSCDHCSYTTVRKYYLVRHMRTHTGEKPFSCDHCDYKCTGSSNLKTHVRTHTGEKPYACKHCDYRCSNAKSLKSHMTTHTGEKPYSCKYCDYRCSTNSCLIAHTRRHTGERPYSCNRCDYKGAQVASLKNHMKTHR